MVTEQRRDFVTRLHHLHQKIAILGIGAVVEFGIQALAQIGALGEFENRKSVGIVSCNFDFPVCPWFVTVNVILRQAIEFGGAGYFHAALVVGNVAFEQGDFSGQIVIELLETRASGIVFIHAGQPKLE